MKVSEFDVSQGSAKSSSGHRIKSAAPISFRNVHAESLASVLFPRKPVKCTIKNVSVKASMTACWLQEPLHRGFYE